MPANKRQVEQFVMFYIVVVVSKLFATFKLNKGFKRSLDNGVIIMENVTKSVDVQTAVEHLKYLQKNLPQLIGLLLSGLPAISEEEQGKILAKTEYIFDEPALMELILYCRKLSHVSSES